MFQNTVDENVSGNGDGIEEMEEPEAAALAAEDEIETYAVDDEFVVGGIKYVITDEDAGDACLLEDDGTPDDGKWYGWDIMPPEPVYTVTIEVNKNHKPWPDHGRTYALRANGGKEFITDLIQVENET